MTGGPGGTDDHRGASKRVAVVVLALVVIAACQVRLTEQQEDTGLAVRNNTESILKFRMLADGEWYERISVPPGDLAQLISNTDLTASSIGRDGCTIGVLVAFDPDGREVTRHEPGLCVGDTWVIEDSDLRQPASSAAS
jgi:hypothetical protein